MRCNSGRIVRTPTNTAFSEYIQFKMHLQNEDEDKGTSANPYIAFINVWDYEHIIIDGVPKRKLLTKVLTEKNSVATDDEKNPLYKGDDRLL